MGLENQIGRRPEVLIAKPITVGSVGDVARNCAAELGRPAAKHSIMRFVEQATATPGIHAVGVAVDASGSHLAFYPFLDIDPNNEMSRCAYQSVEALHREAKKEITKKCKVTGVATPSVSMSIMDTDQKHVREAMSSLEQFCIEDERTALLFIVKPL